MSPVSSPLAVAEPHRDYQAQLRLIRLQRYLSKRDLEWLEAQNPAAARSRRQWSFRQFAALCGELQQEQRRISRERSMAQCASVGELLAVEVRVTARIAELLFLGGLHFYGITSNASRIIEEYLGIDRLIHPESSAPTPALG